MGLFRSLPPSLPACVVCGTASHPPMLEDKKKIASLIGAIEVRHNTYVCAACIRDATSQFARVARFLK